MASMTPQWQAQRLVQAHVDDLPRVGATTRPDRSEARPDHRPPGRRHRSHRLRPALAHLLIRLGQRIAPPDPIRGEPGLGLVGLPHLGPAGATQPQRLSDGRRWPVDGSGD